VKQGRSDTNLSTRGYNGGNVGGGKVEPRGMGRTPGVVAQIGNQKGDHVTEKRQASNDPLLPWVTKPVLPQPVGPTSGMGEGPGANRVVLSSGSQGLGTWPKRT
jgi:hypothetical protein